MPASSTYAFGIQFANIGADKEFPVAKLVTVVPEKSSTVSGSSDQLQVWSMTEKKFKTYWNKKGKGWVLSTATGSVTTDTVKNGDAVYFKRPSGTAGTVTVSGEVVKTTDGKISIPVTANSTKFIANPWPVAFNIADLATYVKDSKSSTVSGSSDQVQVWDTEKKKYVMYWNKKNTGYVLSTSTSKVTTEKILPGQGFMFKRPSGSDCVIEFPQPSGL